MFVLGSGFGVAMDTMGQRISHLMSLHSLSDDNEQPMICEHCIDLRLNVI